MATIINRGSYQFQAIIRRKGHPTQTKTFESKREAEAWAAVIESEMVRGVFIPHAEAERTTLGAALERYLARPTMEKAGLSPAAVDVLSKGFQGCRAESPRFGLVEDILHLPAVQWLAGAFGEHERTAQAQQRVAG